jgi:S1-C subfamily serine protease
VITRIGDQAVTSWEQLRPAIRRNTPGTTADVTVDRDGDRVTLHVKFEEDPGAS